MNARHSKATPRWGSPEDIIERSRRCMGSIDLDPCSEERFNLVVKAATYYDLLGRGEDGLVMPWFGNVYCNPPGGLVTEFWRKALSEPVERVIWCGFSVEQLCLLANEEAHPMDFSWCILRKRLPFARHDGYQGSPSHGNYIAGLAVDHSKFEQEFGPLGKIGYGKAVRMA